MHLVGFIARKEYVLYLRPIHLLIGARGGAIGWGTLGSIPDGVIEIFH